MRLTGVGSFFAFLCFGGLASAHPHVFIDDLLTVTYSSPAVLERLDFSWTFDNLFSAPLIADYSRTKKGGFTETEIMNIKGAAFDNLSKFHWFITLRLGSREIALKDVDRFTATIRGDRIVYGFGFPLKLALANPALPLSIRIYDDSYYTAFNKALPSAVTIAGSPPAAVSVSIEKDSVKSAWPGQWMPDVIVLRAK